MVLPSHHKTKVSNDKLVLWLNMQKMKDIDCKVLSELMKNSKASDHKLAEKLGVSQPTVTRKRARLEKELIDGYTAIPNWQKLGYEIFAITLAKIKNKTRTKDRIESVRSRGLKWLNGQSNIIMSSGCRGNGVDAFTISIHKTYPDYDKFLHELAQEMGDVIDGYQSVIVDLTGDKVLKPLNLKYLAEEL